MINLGSLVFIVATDQEYLRGILCLYLSVTYIHAFAQSYNTLLFIAYFHWSKGIKSGSTCFAVFSEATTITTFLAFMQFKVKYCTSFPELQNRNFQGQ